MRENLSVPFHNVAPGLHRTPARGLRNEIARRSRYFFFAAFFLAAGFFAAFFLAAMILYLLS